MSQLTITQLTLNVAIWLPSPPKSSLCHCELNQTLKCLDLPAVFVDRTKIEKLLDRDYRGQRSHHWTLQRRQKKSQNARGSAESCGTGGTRIPAFSQRLPTWSWSWTVSKVGLAPRLRPAGENAPSQSGRRNRVSASQSPSEEMFADAMV